MANTPNAYEPRTTGPERRALYDLRRQVDNLIQTGVPGPPGPTGPQGPAGPAGTGTPAYVHIQATPAAVWTINHPLGYHANITVVDSAHTQVEGDVNYPSVSTITVRFSAAFAGQAYLS